ncbi:MAG TPA: MBL fold metallo-hydrolase [Chloroflexota bacterium]|nr:MBL fold metallo-hydrolase [Chloroflexota bacterium]
MLSVTILGSGTSHGVPMIGCDCRVCTSADPRDKRTRPSIVVGIDDHNVLIDTSPELRLQLVATGIGHIESVLYTHGHADHLHGIDDLRRFNEQLQCPVPVYATPALLDEIRHRFAYIFAHQWFGGGIPSLDLRPIEGPFELFGHVVLPVPVMHGALPVFGYRFGPFAYVTDTSYIPPDSQELLQDLDVLVLDALRREPHPTHFNFEQALAMVEQLRPRRAYFTHLTHGASHAELEQALPAHVRPAYDGLRLEFR